MEVDVLGPLQVRLGDSVTLIAGVRLRALLISLAVNPVGECLSQNWPRRSGPTTCRLTRATR